MTEDGDKSNAGHVTIYFLLAQGKTHETCSEDLSDAFDQSVEGGLSPSWITSDKALSMKPSKTDVFVVDPFDGPAFEHLTKYKCTIVGPRCLVTCLQKGEPVPDLPYPMYTAAFRNLIVTSTGCSKEKKNEIQQKIERMGGIYSNAFHDGVTHLICSLAKSKKYEVAVDKEVPIMTTDWISQVWEKGKHDSVHATDPQFSRYKCPSLQGLVVTISQLVKNERETLKKLIENHGGIYSPALDMESTMLVVLAKAEGDKYKYAKKWKIPCVTSNWVFDSVEKGFCLPTKDYGVELLNDRVKVSTPEKMDKTVAKLQEVSMCSTILHPNEEATSKINETAAANMTTTALLNGVKKPSENVLFDAERVKKAGHFLEDCRLFLSGFLDSEIDKYRLTIQNAGGVSLSQLTPSVTHMVIKSPVDEHFQLLTQLQLAPYKVTLQWIVESMLMGRPVPEEDFVFHYQPNIQEPRKSKEDAETQFEDDLLAHYQNNELAANVKDMQEDNNAEDEETQVEKFMHGKKLYLIGLESEQESEMVDWIVEAGGEVVSMEETGDIDYLITNIIFDPKKKKLSMTAKETLTHLWLDDCFDEGKIVPVLYYHVPITLDPELKPCSGAVIGISNYSGRERSYISSLAQVLGMISQEVFAKRDKNGAKRNTHLVCKGAEGTKYDAALNWGIPIVDKDWLLKCLKHQNWLSETEFWVGNSDICTPGKPTAASLEEPEVDEEIVIKKPIELTTPKDNPKRRKLSRKSFETPEVDLERFRPKKFNLDMTAPEGNSPSKWAAGSEPSFASSQAPPASQLESSKKRKREEDDIALRGVSTPQTPYGAFLVGPNPSPRTRKMYKIECEALGKFQLPDSELQEKRAKVMNLDESLIDPTNPEMAALSKASSEDTPNREKFKDDLEAKGLVVLARDKRRFSDIMEEKANKLGKSWKDPGKKIKLVSRLSQSLANSAMPLASVVVYVTKKLDHFQAEIQSAVEELGGSVQSQYNSQVTHVIFSGKSNDLTKEFRTARDDKKFIVSPEWIKMCRDEKRRVEESLFPHTYNPKMSLSMSISSEKATSKRGKSKSSNDHELSAQLAKMDELIDESKHETNEEEAGNQRRNSIKMRLSSVSDSTPKAAKESQAVAEKTQVMWVDPSEEEDRQKLADKLEKNVDSQSQKIANGQTFDTLDLPENLTEALMEHHDKENPPCFTFSNFTPEDCEAFSTFAMSHGAKIISAVNPGPEPESTHVIASKMSRSEKMLGSIASGKWILHPSYVQDCLKSGTLISDYDKYEWGNPQADFLQGLKPQEVAIGKAARKWRQIIGADPLRGPFTGIRAIIHTSESRKGAFARLILTGKGRVLDEAQPPYKESLGATHCLAELKRLPNTKLDYEALAKHRVAVVGPLYMNEFLITDPTPCVEDFIIEDYKSFWQKHKS